MLNKSAPSRRKTKIIKEAMENAPATSKNLVVYQYNFKRRDYEIYNPFNFQMSTKYPYRKIRLVCRDIRTNVKEFPRPRFQRSYLRKIFIRKNAFFSDFSDFSIFSYFPLFRPLLTFLVLTFILESIMGIFLTCYYGYKIFNISEKVKDKDALEMQYITSFIILILLCITAGVLMYLHKKTRYIAKLRARRHTMNKLF
jgi:hypothetical protein